MDFTSLKVFPVELMKKHKGEVVGLHPLFGPLVKSPEGETIVVVDERPGEKWKELENFFQKKGFNLVYMDPHTHDRTMAIIQNIPHIINYSFLAYLKGKNPSLTTPVFLLQKYLAGRILSQNPQLYFDMGTLNPYGREEIKDYLNNFQHFADLLEKNDKTFMKELETLQSHYQTFIEEAKLKTGRIWEIVKEKKKRPTGLVGYLGPEGSFTHILAKKLFDHLKPYSTIPQIFKDVENGALEWGVVPAENSIAGYVNETYDSLIRFNVKVATSFIMEINHALLSVESSLKDIQKIVSHPKAIEACRGFIEMLGVPVEYASSTTARLAEREPGVGYIAHESNAQGLNVLARNIQDHKDNYTEFYIIGKKEGFSPTKTLFALSIVDRKGALRDILNVFEKVNLSKIFSRPARLYGLDYVFFIEAEFKDKKLEKEIIKEVQPLVHYWKVAGYTHDSLSLQHH